MSEWPNRYEPSDYIHGLMVGKQKGDWIKFEDFEKLLTFTVNSLSPSHPGPLHLDKLKESILLQLKKR
jgi:hypothetical protein